MSIDRETAEELFQQAEEFFVDNKYQLAEPILNQLVLKAYNRPEIFHMLGTIYYDQGKFKKAIRSFERALEIDPSFTDSSVGLSIILNDLGRYEEGQKVFDQAKLMLAQKNKTQDDHINEKIAAKHEELADLYIRYGRASEGLEQLQKALSLSKRKADIRLRVADCYFAMSENTLAVRELREILKENPQFVPGLLRLGRAYYDLKQIPEAIEQWELAQQIEPNNKTARDYLRLVQTVQVTTLNRPELEL